MFDKSKATLLKAAASFISVAFTCVFVFGLFMNSSTAWFAHNEQVNASGMSVKVKENNYISIESCHALRYVDEVGIICEEVGDNYAVEMQKYDRIFTALNVNTLLLFRLQISNVPDVAGSSITVNVPCTGNFITVGDDETQLNSHTKASGDNIHILGNISNVLKLGVGFGSTVGYDDNADIETEIPAIANIETQTNKTIFTKVRDGFDANGTYNSYASINEGEYSKQKGLSFTLNYADYASSLFDYENTRGKNLIIYILFNYKVDLVDEFYTSNETLVDENNVITVENDIDTILISENWGNK